MAFEQVIAEILVQNKEKYQQEIDKLSPDESGDIAWLLKKQDQIYRALCDNEYYDRKYKRKNRAERKRFENVIFL